MCVCKGASVLVCACMYVCTTNFIINSASVQMEKHLIKVNYQLQIKK